MATSRSSDKQNITISLSRQVLRKARILAARRETSVSGLIAHQIESLVRGDEAYECAQRQATALLERGFRLGGLIKRVGMNCMNDRAFIDTNVLIYAHTAGPLDRTVSRRIGRDGQI